MASMSATRALARAVAMASPWDEVRKLMLASESRPTAMTVSKIINERVTIKAKPRGRERWVSGFSGRRFVDFMDFGEGFEIEAEMGIAKPRDFGRSI